MVYRGHVENGAIRLDDAPVLPEGIGVEVRLLTGYSSQAGEENVPSLYERLKDVVGMAKGLPPDASANVDHYLYGHPKR
ncbi:MAG: hypothetical protein ABSF26_24515 [Thermoguttaceae bacterium]|jgi:hypothetical protein